MSYSKLFPIDISTTTKSISKVFNKRDVCRIAHQTKFVRRSTSRLDGWELLHVLVEKAIAPESAPLSICCDAIAEINPKAKMTVQSLRERINSEGCVNFLETILSERVVSCSQKIYKELFDNLPPMGKNALQIFSGIRVFDSTEMPLHYALSKYFKGSGGEKNAEACVKILAVCEVKTGIFGKFIIADRNSPDQGLGIKALEMVEKQSLNLMDKGFCKIDFYEAINKKEAYYITPLHKSISVYKQKKDEKSIELAKHIKKKIEKYGFFDEELYISSKKIPQRIVAFSLPDAVVQRKLRYYYERCKKDKRSPSAENIARQELVIFLTNTSKEMVSAELVSNLYSIRWQIELVFKSWKSQMKLNLLLGRNPNRIKVLLLSRLITISIIAIAMSPVRIILEAYEDEELSLHKFINWFKQRNRLSDLLTGSKTLFKDILDASKRWLCKESNRKRKTSRRRIIENLEYVYAA